MPCSARVEAKAIHDNLIREAHGRIDDFTQSNLPPQVPTLKGSQRGMDWGDSVDGPSAVVDQGVKDTRLEG